MAAFRPFAALRPAKELASQVAALPYDVVTREEAKKIGEENPYSFLHVDRAEIDLDPQIDPYSPQVYEKARETLKKMEQDGIMRKDPSPRYYIYQQQMKEYVQTGLVGCASIDDYLNNVVKRHELTREEKEQDRIRHVDVCDANTGPIFLTGWFPMELIELRNRWIEEHEAEYDFTAEDGIVHRVWVIDDPDTIRLVEDYAEKIPSLYIADGHHRAASAVKVGEKRRQEHPGYTGEEEFNYFLSVLFPCRHMQILPYNRVVRDKNGFEEKAILNMVKLNFELLFFPGFPCKPIEPHCFGMYMGGQWYHLRAREESYDHEDPIASLDVSILQKNLLDPILGIKDPRTDERIRFVGGIKGLKELESMADQTDGIAFSMYPTTIEELMAIADAGEIMPPKSTWFEPKLRSGLFIHELGTDKEEN